MRLSPEYLDTLVAGKGHSDHPWLHSEYSLSSRIPCCDLTPIIADRFACHDVESVKYIVGKLLEANPGLGVHDPRSWSDRNVDAIAHAPFQKYVRFDDVQEEARLRAIFAILSLSRGAFEFSLIEGTPELLGWAFAGTRPVWQPSLEELRLRANRFIRTMRKDTPYWRDIPLVEGPPMAEPSLSAQFRKQFLALPIMSRVHAMCAFERGGGLLESLTDYRIRKLGLKLDESASAIIDSGVFIITDSDQLMLSKISKPDFQACSEESGVQLASRATKAAYLTALKATAPENLRRLARKLRVAEPNPEYKTEMHNLFDYSRRIGYFFAILGFGCVKQ